MPSDPYYREFVAFAATAEADLRLAVRRTTTDPGLVHHLMVRALARVAQRWSVARAGNPHAYLMEQLESETNAWWRAHNEDEPPAEPPDLESTPSLADQAWALSRTLQKTRRRTVTIVLALVVVLVVVYAWSVNSGESAGPPAEQTAQQATTVSGSVAVLPPPGLVATARNHSPALPDHIDGDEATEPLKDSPVDTMVAAFQPPSKPVQVLGNDGKVRTVDVDSDTADGRSVLPQRGLAASGHRLALLTDSGLIVVDREGNANKLKLPSTVGEVRDVAWYPSGEQLLATSQNGSYRIDVTTGQLDELKLYGPGTAFAFDDNDAFEFVSNSAERLTLQPWHGKKAADPMVLSKSLPVSKWHGVPVGNSGMLVRGGIPKPDVDIPSKYGKPISCVTAIDAKAKDPKTLIVTDQYPNSPSLALLGARDNEVYFTVPNKTGDVKTLVVWSSDTQNLARMFTLESDIQLAVGEVKAQ